MSVLDEVISDMKRMGYGVAFKSIGGGAWRLSFLRHDFSQPSGYYRDFSDEEKNDEGGIVQWILIMYLQTVDDRVKGKKGKYAKFRKLLKLK